MANKIKSTVKGFIKQVTPYQTRRLVRFLRRSQSRVEKLERNLERIGAIALRQHYPTLVPDHLKNAFARSIINHYELGVYSQNGEDGILLHIFSQIGTSNCTFIEFGMEDGRECNSANLAINFGWRGLLMDINEKDVASARQYYDAVLGDKKDNVKIIQCMVTRDNINTVLKNNKVEAEVDLLCIDIDSNDYYVWQAITDINPRVVVVEINPAYGPERSLTVKYREFFDRFSFHPTGFYFGASLTAFTKLADQKGYVLVGCESTGNNAFYVRKDMLAGNLQAMTPQQAYYRDMRLHSDVRQDGDLVAPDAFEFIKHLDFVEI